MKAGRIVSALKKSWGSFCKLLKTLASTRFFRFDRKDELSNTIKINHSFHRNYSK